MSMATSLQWKPLLPSSSTSSTSSTSSIYHHHHQCCFGNNNNNNSLNFQVKSSKKLRGVKIKAFQRSDFDGFAKKVTSKEAWKDAWRSANDGFEQLVYDAKKAAERLDRQYSISRRFDSIKESALIKVKEIDREYEIGRRWNSFSVDFSRNSPRYRKQLSDFLNSPLGRSFATIFFLWFALSGWLFRVLIFATFVLPIAAPLLIGTVAKNFVIEGACPQCKRKFAGIKNQVVRCQSCGNTVWQPKESTTSDFFSRGGGGSKFRSKSDPDIIDVEFEEK
ncbi:hypothetical protein C5167_032293 [Papaver somniferum]|uniref:Uncharacterized protein n=1 Tax=Papaver somniferum TaxID=3469 RepID=A0A4Y7KB48_PAPSO|nr:uncharacterized protein LOC113297227 [Papaver somniferum]RZC69195.1 hypothetical protein C5167_032293 [Papaver somniferum]